MTKKLLFVTTILMALAFLAFAADVSGKWTYDQPGRGGGDPTPVVIELKASGATVTGSVLGGMGGRGGGGAPTPSEISSGKVEGDKVTFEVKRTTPNGDQVTKYEGTVSGDAMKLKVTRPGRGGGDPTTTEFDAKRSKS